MFMRRHLLLLFIVSLSSNAISDDMSSPGEVWLKWSDYTRSIYLSGFSDGASRIFVEAASKWLPKGSLHTRPSPKHIQSVVEKTYTSDQTRIMNITTSLYQDPANVYIPFGDMFYLSREKLGGEDISSKLIKYRKRAIKERELLKKMEVYQ